MRNMEFITAEIVKAYNVYRTLPGTNEYMMISEIADRTDLTKEEIHAGLLKLKLSPEHNIGIYPESNQKVLTATERHYAMWLGNQWKHVVEMW